MSLVSTKRMSVTVSIEPRLAGERKPSIAQTIEMNAMPSSCMPVPTCQTRERVREVCVWAVCVCVGRMHAEQLHAGAHLP